MLKPTGRVSPQKAHIVFLCDTSGSMSGERMANLNTSISAALSEAQSVVATLNPSKLEAIDVSAIRFSDTADWHIVPSKLHEQFIWDELAQPMGITNLGQAYALLDSWLSSGAINGTIGTLIVVLITDGMPTDQPITSPDWSIDKKVADNFERIAFALGSDAESSHLDEFVSDEDNLYILRNESMLSELLTRALTKAIKKIPDGQYRQH